MITSQKKEDELVQNKFKFLDDSNDDEELQNNTFGKAKSNDKEQFVIQNKHEPKPNLEKFSSKHTAEKHDQSKQSMKNDGYESSDAEEHEEINPLQISAQNESDQDAYENEHAANSGAINIHEHSVHNKLQSERQEDYSERQEQNSKADDDQPEPPEDTYEEDEFEQPKAGCVGDKTSIYHSL